MGDHLTALRRSAFVTTLQGSAEIYGLLDPGEEEAPVKPNCFWRASESNKKLIRAPTVAFINAMSIVM
jgi:hypothetical protein